MPVTLIYSPTARVIKGRGPANKIMVTTTELGAQNETIAVTDSVVYDATISGSLVYASNTSRTFSATDDKGNTCPLVSNGLFCAPGLAGKLHGSGIGIDGPVFRSPVYGDYKEKMTWDGLVTSQTSSGAWLPNSLAKHIENQFLAMINGRNPTLATSVSRESPTSFIAGYEMSGLGAAGQTPACLISNRHAVVAFHTGIAQSVGLQLGFRGVLGTNYSPRIMRGTAIYSDLAIVTFEAPLPIYNPLAPSVDGLVPFQLLPPNYKDWLPPLHRAFSTYNLPEKITFPILTKCANYDGRFAVQHAWGFEKDYFYKIPKPGYFLAPWCPTPSPSAIAGGILYGGDSGSPDFIPINGKLVLLGSHFAQQSTPFISGSLVALQTEMNAVVTGYSPSYVDLSSFQKYLTP